MENLNNEQQVIMNTETIHYFLEGLRVVIKRSGLKQGVWAKGVTSEVNISNILRGKTGTSDEMRDALAKRAGLDIAEIVLLGKQANDQHLGKPHPTPPPQSIPGVQANHINPTDVMTAVATLVGQYQKLDERMRFWRLIFDILPVATLIIKDGLVYYQNLKSRYLGSIVGTDICDSCAGIGCENKEECPVTIAIREGIETSGYQMIGPVRYKVDAIPARMQEHDYFIVTATPTPADGTTERRAGVVDRREAEE